MEAEQVYELINSGFVYDFHLAPFILTLMGEKTREEWFMLMKKLSLIHSIISQHKKDNPEK